MWMTDRERWLAILDYRQPDRPLVMQWMGFSQHVLPRWRQEGLPREVSPEQYFGLAEVRSLPVSVFPHPPREDILLEQGPHSRVVRDNRDLILRHDEHAPYFPQFLDHPVKSRRDWERYRARINRGCESRYETLRAKAAQYRDSPSPVILSLRGCWEIRYFMGMTEALCALHDDPGLVVEMLDFWFGHQWEIIARVCAYVVPDAVCLWEDLAYKNGPFVSPAMYGQFFAPYHRETARRLQAHGVRHFLVDCDGNIDLLLPLFLEQGITGVYPLEIQSGADPVKFRARYGKTVQLLGGIDKRALIAGPEATAAEVERTLAQLIPGSGYLPGVDHAVPPEVPLATFQFYLDHLREVWGGLLGEREGGARTRGEIGRE
jgi:uroporphyrinogen decarboxylase